jgi:hypothetical protein
MLLFARQRAPQSRENRTQIRITVANTLETKKPRFTGLLARFVHFVRLLKTLSWRIGHSHHALQALSNKALRESSSCTYPYRYPQFDLYPVAIEYRKASRAHETFCGLASMQMSNVGFQRLACRLFIPLRPHLRNSKKLNCPRKRKSVKSGSSFFYLDF